MSLWNLTQNFLTPTTQYLGSQYQYLGQNHRTTRVWKSIINLNGQWLNCLSCTIIGTTYLLIIHLYSNSKAAYPHKITTRTIKSNAFLNHTAYWTILMNFRHDTIFNVWSTQKTHFQTFYLYIEWWWDKLLKTLLKALKPLFILKSEAPAYKESGATCCHKNGITSPWAGCICVIKLYRCVYNIYIIKRENIEKIYMNLLYYSYIITIYTIL